MARVLIVAGEASGDAHGAGLVRAVHERRPAVRFAGIGGPAMAAAGVEVIGRAEDLAVVGLTEVIGRLPAVLRLLGRMRAEIRRNPPDLLVPIDAPDFNLRLTSFAAQRGVPVVYFIAPQLWAWRANRVRQLRRNVRELLVMFPFEEKWFSERGVNTRYVGHPRVDEARVLSAAKQADTRQQADSDSAVSHTGLLLPGSRRGEIARHLPIMAQATRLIGRTQPQLTWRLRAAPGIEDSFYARDLRDTRIALSRDPLLELAANATVAVAASGTASFEAALMGTPLVVIYRLSPLTWQLARRMVRVDWVAMANLSAGRAIVPELLQDECRAERIAAEVQALLTDSARRERMRADLSALREVFGPPGAYARAAERVLYHLDQAAQGARPA